MYIRELLLLLKTLKLECDIGNHGSCRLLAFLAES